MGKSFIKELQGSDKYTIWAISIEALLRKEMTNIINETDDVSPEINSSALCRIQLCLDDGLLVQVKQYKRAHILKNGLENIYWATGFNSEIFKSHETAQQ